MDQRTRRVFIFLVCLAAAFGTARAQTPNTITVRMIDIRTGMLIPTSNFLIRINHQQTEHGDWAKQNEDGTGILTLSADAEVVSIHATYDSATLVYANCDADKDHWYPVAEILAKGIVAPNDCIGKKVPEKLQVVAKPGEFVFFVRLLSARERFRE